MTAGESRERLKIFDVRRDDVIAILREQHQSGIDHVAPIGSCEQLTGGAAQQFVERTHVEAGKRLREERLPWPRAAPHLANDAAMGDRTTRPTATP